MIRLLLYFAGGMDLMLRTIRHAKRTNVLLLLAVPFYFYIGWKHEQALMLVLLVLLGSYFFIMAVYTMTWLLTVKRSVDSRASYRSSNSFRDIRSANDFIWTEMLAHPLGIDDG